MLKYSALHGSIVAELKRSIDINLKLEEEIRKYRNDYLSEDTIDSTAWAFVPVIHSRATIDFDALYAMETSKVFLNGRHMDINTLLIPHALKPPHYNIVYDHIVSEWADDAWRFRMESKDEYFDLDITGIGGDITTKDTDVDLWPDFFKELELEKRKPEGMKKDEAPKDNNMWHSATESTECSTSGTIIILDSPIDECCCHPNQPKEKRIIPKEILSECTTNLQATMTSTP